MALRARDVLVRLPCAVSSSFDRSAAWDNAPMTASAIPKGLNDVGSPLRLVPQIRHRAVEGLELVPCEKG